MMPDDVFLLGAVCSDQGHMQLSGAAGQSANIPQVLLQLYALT